MPLKRNAKTVALGEALGTAIAKKGWKEPLRRLRCG
jgi:hypothetical protein